MELRLISTTYEGKERITKEQTIPFCDDAGREDQLINLYPQVTYQRMDGFGGAITDSAAYIYSLMNPEQKKQMLGEYFGQGKMKYRFVRIPVDSCDFSLSHYEADGDEADVSVGYPTALRYVPSGSGIASVGLSSDILDFSGA